MVRVPLLLAALLLPSLALAQPTLRREVVVDAPVIRLGDLFAGAGPHADAAIARAPAPGGRVVYDAAWLVARAREQNLDWQPRSPYEVATVERAGQAITADEIAKELRHELAGRLPAGPVRLDLDNPSIRLFVPTDAAPTVTVDNLTYDPRSGRVTALVSAPAGDAAAEPVRVTARVRRLVALPALSRPIAPGEVIAAADVETVELRADRMTESYLTDAADLVGKTPRHMLRPGEPVRPSDVQAPILVHKGELVTVVLQTPSLMLTTQAKALEDGAAGAAIRLANTQSGRILDAVVTGPGAASVASPGAPHLTTR